MHDNIIISNCPCCGGEADLHSSGGGDFRDREGKKYFIKCEKCGIATKHSTSLDEVLSKWENRQISNKFCTKHFCFGLIIGILLASTAFLFVII